MSKGKIQQIKEESLSFSNTGWFQTLVKHFLSSEIVQFYSSKSAESVGKSICICHNPTGNAEFSLLQNLKMNTDQQYCSQRNLVLIGHKYHRFQAAKHSQEMSPNSKFKVKICG